MSISIPLSSESMLGIGIGLSAVGVIYWNLPALQKKKSDMHYASTRVNAVTDLRFQRASFFGRFLLTIGLLMILADVLRSV